MGMPRVSKVLSDASKIRGRKAKVEFLRSHWPNKTMLKLFEHAFNPTMRFDLPEGDPPYTPAVEDGAEMALHQHARKFYLFTKDGNPNLKPMRRERLFIDLLEGVHPEDAKLLLAVKSGKLPHKGLTEKLIREAYPDLLPNEEENE